MCTNISTSCSHPKQKNNLQFQPGQYICNNLITMKMILLTLHE